MMLIRIILPICMLIWMSLRAENEILSSYIDLGLDNNLALRQKEFTLQQSFQALSQARGLFLPSVDIEARYSRAGGGRQIDFPVGDLINPVHLSLNELLQRQGLPPRFPGNLENVSIPFLREEEHDTKVRLQQPVFHPEIYFNYQVKKYLAQVREAEKNAFTRKLISEIKSAYYGYLKTARIVELFSATGELLEENLRVSQKLFQADKVTEEAVFRAEVELSELRQNQAEAGKNKTLAQAYFNFLLNRPLDEEIEEMSGDSLRYHEGADLAAAEASALTHRDEFFRVQMAVKAAANGIKLSEASFLPNIAVVLDYGFQGETYRFGENNDYWMASAILRWNLFNGFQDKAKIQQARLEKKKLEAQLMELEKQIQLQVRKAHQNLLVAGKVLVTANDRVVSARKSFKIVNKKYQQGVTPQIEYLDARNTLTRAEINQIISRYDYQIRQAEFERAAALYPLEQAK